MSDGSAYDRLFYPFLFADQTTSVEAVLANVRASTHAKCQDVIALRRATLQAYERQIVEAGVAIARAFARGALLLAFGNGGSTTDAQDLVADLSMPPDAYGAPLPAIALTNDSAVITAIGNDVGVDAIFSRQVIAFGRSGDIAVGISTSGSSKNVLLGLEQAKKQGMLTIGLAGSQGGIMAQMAALDYCIVVASDHIPRIQEVQATISHTLLTIIWETLKRDGLSTPEGASRS